MTKIGEAFTAYTDPAWSETQYKNQSLNETVLYFRNSSEATNSESLQSNTLAPILTTIISEF